MAVADENLIALGLLALCSRRGRRIGAHSDAGQIEYTGRETAARPQLASDRPPPPDGTPAYLAGTCTVNRMCCERRRASSSSPACSLTGTDNTATACSNNFSGPFA